tara:strand:- start:309 stop:623 length:315 start_codon:yes stop_codon:yes gene_type:complete
MKKIPKQKKTNTPEEKIIIQNSFMESRYDFLDDYNKHHNIIKKNFPLYAVDITQVPCLLTMDIIANSEVRMTKEEFISYKDYVRDVLDGYRPPIKFEVIEGGKK